MILNRTQLDAAAEGLYRHLSPADARYADATMESKTSCINAVKAALHPVLATNIVVAKNKAQSVASYDTYDGFGRTPAEAIGDLVRSFPELFNVQINLP